MLMVGVLVSTALAGAVKIKDFDFSAGPLSNSGADGMAILNFTGNGETIVQIALTGVLADTYQVALAENPDDPSAGLCDAFWQITVDSHGAATIHDRLTGDFSGRGVVVAIGDACNSNAQIPIAVGRHP